MNRVSFAPTPPVTGWINGGGHAKVAAFAKKGGPEMNWHPVRSGAYRSKKSQLSEVLCIVTVRVPRVDLRMPTEDTRECVWGAPISI